MAHSNSLMRMPTTKHIFHVKLHNLIFWGDEGYKNSFLYKKNIENVVYYAKLKKYRKLILFMTSKLTY